MQQKRKEGLFWLVVSEISVHGHFFFFFIAFMSVFGREGPYGGDHAVEQNNSPHSREEKEILVSETLPARFFLLLLHSAS